MPTGYTTYAIGDLTDHHALYVRETVTGQILPYAGVVTHGRRPQ